MKLTAEQRLAEGYLLNWMGDFDVVVPAPAFDALRDKLAADMPAVHREAEQEALKEIAKSLTVMMMMSAKCFVDPADDDAVIGYRIKTGAIHKVIGLLAGLGHTVSIPSNMPLADEDDEFKNAAEWRAHYVPNDFVLGDNTKDIASVVSVDAITKAMRLDEIVAAPLPRAAPPTDDARDAEILRTLIHRTYSCDLKFDDAGKVRALHAIFKADSQPGYGMKESVRRYIDAFMQDAALQSQGEAR